MLCKPQFQRRLTRRLQALASYSWAHSIDIASNDSFNVNTPRRVSIRAPIVDLQTSTFGTAFNGAVTYDIASLLKTGGRNEIFRNWSVEYTFTARRQRR